MELKQYKFNEDFFELLKGTDYEALKRDIKENGIKTALHILPDGTVICGNQRLRIIKELKIPDDKIPKKIVSHLKTDEEIKEYVIKDNLLRRHLKPEQRAFLIDELSKLYEVGRGIYGRGRPKLEDANLASSIEKDVNKKTAKELNQSPRTVARSRAYVKAVKKEPKYSGWKISTVLRDVKINKQKEEIKKLEPEKAISGVYDVIVLDPPWNFDDLTPYDEDGKRGTINYPSMSLDKLKNIKLPTAKDCIVWVWVPNSRFKEALELIDAWKLDRKTLLTWNKEIMGVGNYLRNITEHCFLCFKGNPPWDNKKYTTLISEKRTKHSVKPEAFYKMVDEICVGRKLDYFARKKREGWDVYGDEV